jgi:hypothetical protein
MKYLVALGALLWIVTSVVVFSALSDKYGANHPMMIFGPVTSVGLLIAFYSMAKEVK